MGKCDGLVSSHVLQKKEDRGGRCLPAASSLWVKCGGAFVGYTMAQKWIERADTHSTIYYFALLWLSGGRAHSMMTTYLLVITDRCPCPFLVSHC